MNALSKVRNQVFVAAMAVLTLFVGGQSAFATGPTLPSMGFSISDVITALAQDLGTALTAVVLFGAAVLIISIAWRWLKGSAKSR